MGAMVHPPRPFYRVALVAPNAEKGVTYSTSGTQFFTLVWERVKVSTLDATTTRPMLLTGSACMSRSGIGSVGPHVLLES